MKKLKYLFSQEWFCDLFSYVVEAFWFLMSTPMALRYCFSPMNLPDWSVELCVAGLLTPSIVRDVLMFYRRKDKEVVKNV